MNDMPHVTASQRPIALDHVNRAILIIDIMVNDTISLNGKSGLLQGSGVCMISDQ